MNINPAIIAFAFTCGIPVGLMLGLIINRIVNNDSKKQQVHKS